jgi:hypothetical protein
MQWLLQPDQATSNKQQAVFIHLSFNTSNMMQYDNLLYFILESKERNEIIIICNRNQIIKL